MTFLPALIVLALLAGSVLAVATVGMVAMGRLEQAHWHRRLRAPAALTLP